MADIKVERKRTGVWVWVVGLLVAALLIWALAELFGEGDLEEDAPTTVEPMGAEGAPPPAVASGLRIS